MALKELLTNLEQGLQSYPNHNTPSTSGGFGYGGTRIFDSKSFRQRDFEFGKGTAYDRPGQEFSREPLIGKNIAIPDPNSQPSAALGFIDSISDGLIRGGLATSISRSAQDVARISKFYLTSRGINFLIKQIGLQKSNPNIEAGSTSFEIFGLGFNLNRNTTFNAGLNLIAQAGVNASGVHFDRSGATPIWPEDQKYEKSVLSSLKPDTVGSLSNNNGVEGGNRLLTLHSSTGVGIGAVENRPDPTGPSGFNLFGINIGGSARIIKENNGTISMINTGGFEINGNLSITGQLTIPGENIQSSGQIISQSHIIGTPIGIDGTGNQDREQGLFSSLGVLNESLFQNNITIYKDKKIKFANQQGTNHTDLIDAAFKTIDVSNNSIFKSDLNVNKNLNVGGTFTSNIQSVLNALIEL